MIRNYFRIAIRNFFRQRTQSILNVAGLAIGLACSMYVYLYAFDELTFDTQHPAAEHTYRLLWKTKSTDGQERVNAWAVEGWAHYMKENLKGVKSYSSLSRLGWPHSFYFVQQNGEQRIILSEDVTYAMKNYSDFFYLDLLAGDENTLFDQPTDILMSETAAAELFGDENALNKQVEMSHPFLSGSQKITVVVKGIFADLPYNIQYGRSTKYILNRGLQKESFERWPPNGSFENSLVAMWWPAYNGSIYFQTEPDADLDFLKEKLKIEINKAASVKLKQPSSIDLQFLKITETHFSGIPFLIQPELVGNRQYLYIFLTIGTLILVISCINYTNLATARSIRRAKEIGIRKAIGSYKGQLVFQFLHEAFFITGVSIILALLMAVVLLPFFSDFANKDFVVADLFTLPSVSVILLLWIIVSFCSGLYPAFYMASLETIKILKGGSKPGKGGKVLRQALIVFQLSISLVLVAFTLVVIRQMNEMINNDLNKEGDQILSIRYGNFAPVNKLQVFRNELSRHPDLSNSSFGAHLPRREGFTNISMEITIPDYSDQKYTWDMMCVGRDFPKVFDLELISGNLFDVSSGVDSTEVLVNEEVARQLQMDVHNILGQQITVRDPWWNKVDNFKIRGVLKDFKYGSIHDKISPLILSIQKNRNLSIIYYIKLPAGKIQKNIAKVEQVWRKVMPPDVGMSHWFISDEFNKLYFQENALHNISRAFTLFGIITTCIGLFGMSMFLAERRRKEMAIRKVMGADSSDVLRKTVAPFIKLIAISCLIGIPIAYYVSNKWLDNFIYKIEWSWMIAVLPISVLIVVTIFTVSFQSLRLVNANPVDSLKQE
ncbi:MAG: FtsX-like permease family protein [Cyclobacteriaceae bacterium]